jgi:VanZ family protein
MSRLLPVFVLYALVLFVATHWPNLRIESDVIERPDLLIHLGAFGLWALLLQLTGLLGPPRSPRTALKTFGVGALYAAVDESSQAIPILGRTAVWDDYVANVVGVALGAAAGCVAARLVLRAAASDRAQGAEPPAE